MPLWKQLLAALVLLAGTGVAWAIYSPAGAPVLAWLGVPPQQAQEPVRGGPGGGFGGGGPTMVMGSHVTEGRANGRVAAIGDGQSVRSVVVTPLDAGRLVSVDVVSGASVDEGQAIARLDSEIETIALERAQLVARDAADTFARVELLRARGAATDVQEREARLAADRARLEERDAALALERRTITAPIGGVVGLLPVEQGMQVTTASEIATIEDRSSLLVEFRVPERVVGQLSVGVPLTATPLARPDLTLEGAIAALDNRIDLDSRTMRVQATLPNADDRLRSGMAFAIDIRLAGDPFLEVDALAIQWSSDGPFVWVARDGGAAREPVRIVQRNAERVLVAGNLAVGERVISEGVQRLRPGAEVRFLGDPPPAETQGEALGGGMTRVDRPVSGG